MSELGYPHEELDSGCSEKNLLKDNKHQRMLRREIIISDFLGIGRTNRKFSFTLCPCCDYPLWHLSNGYRTPSWWLLIPEHTPPYGPSWFQTAPINTIFFLMQRHIYLCHLLLGTNSVLQNHTEYGSLGDVYKDSHWAKFFFPRLNSLFLSHIFHVLWLPSPALPSLLSSGWCFQVCWCPTTAWASQVRHYTTGVPARWACYYIFTQAA